MKPRFERRRRTTMTDLTARAPLGTAELRLVAGGGERQVGGPVLGGGLGSGTVGLSPGQTHMFTLSVDGSIDIAWD